MELHIPFHALPVDVEDVDLAVAVQRSLDREALRRRSLRRTGTPSLTGRAAEDLAVGRAVAELAASFGDCQLEEASEVRSEGGS